MCKVTSLLHICSPPRTSSCIYSVDGHHSIFSHQPSFKCLFTHSPDFATLAFCTVFVLVIPGHAGCGARSWPTSWCRFGTRSQVLCTKKAVGQMAQYQDCCLCPSTAIPSGSQICQFCQSSLFQPCFLEWAQWGDSVHSSICSA